MVRVAGLASLFGPPGVGSERVPSQLECSHRPVAGLSSGILSLDVTSGLAP